MQIKSREETAASIQSFLKETGLTAEQIGKAIGSVGIEMAKTIPYVPAPLKVFDDVAVDILFRVIPETRSIELQLWLADGYKAWPPTMRDRLTRWASTFPVHVVDYVEGVRRSAASKVDESSWFVAIRGLPMVPAPDAVLGILARWK